MPIIFAQSICSLPATICAFTGKTSGWWYDHVWSSDVYKRQPMTHGGGPVHRHAGSMGASSHQSRIFPGKIGAGQMGNEQVTIENLDVCLLYTSRCV